MQKFVTQMLSFVHFEYFAFWLQNSFLENRNRNLNLLIQGVPQLGTDCNPDKRDLKMWL